MTAFELLIAMAVIAVILGGFVAVSESLVTNTADKQTVAVLRTLGDALDAYKLAHGAFPSGIEPADIDTPMARCLAALRSSPATEPLVADLPGQRTTARGYLTLVDGFGRIMLYVHPGEAEIDTEMAKWAARFHLPADKRPFIVSAGPDGHFGDLSAGAEHARAATDNLDSL